MATSGYIHTSSKNPQLFAGDGLVTNSFMPYAVWLGAPINAGTVTHVDLLLYKQGTPGVGIEFEVWRQIGAANGFSIPAAANSWTLMGVASFDPSSVTATVRSNALWVRAQLNTPFWMDSAGQNATDQSAFGFTFGMKLTRAGSWADPSNDIKFPVHSVDNLSFGNTNIRSLDRSSGAKAMDLPYGLYGFVSVSSRFRDAPIGTWTSGSMDASADQSMVSSLFQRRGASFTAVGSSITRFAFDMAFNGSFRELFTPIIYTDSGGTPNVIVATGIIVSINSTSAGSATLFTGNVGSTYMPALFVFSPAVNITSGNVYWAMLEVSSYSSAGGLTGVPVQRVAGKNRASYNAQSNQWAVSSNQTYHFEVWYVDSKTAWDFELDIRTLAPIVSGEGIHRLYPGLNGRQFPSTILREYHRP